MNGNHASHLMMTTRSTTCPSELGHTVEPRNVLAKPRHHYHIDPKAGNTRIVWAVVVNILLTVVQIIGGVLSGSLALIADAIHNLSDALSLGLALFARIIARRPADDTMTFGYGRAEIVAALINYTTLILLGLYLTQQAIVRLFAPTDVDGWSVVIIAVFALGVDTLTAFLTYALSKSSMDIRAAFLHNVADALGSVAVIVAGTVIILYDWRLSAHLDARQSAGSGYSSCVDRYAQRVRR